MRLFYTLGLGLALSMAVTAPAQAQNLASFGIQENTSANTRYALTGRGTPVRSQRQDELYGARATQVAQPAPRPRVVAAQVTQVVCLSDGTCAGRRMTAIAR
ncbi:MAG: hypothetical protein AAFO93_01945 [Pseudomonadota bacterium]